LPTQDADGVTVTFRTPDGEETARVGWVVGADGGHCATRDFVGTALVGGFHGQHFAMADLDIDTTFAPDAIRMFFHTDGMGILFPLADDRARIMFEVDDPGAGAPDPTLEVDRHRPEGRGPQPRPLPGGPRPGTREHRRRDDGRDHDRLPPQRVVRAGRGAPARRAGR
jgi:2-polyprenyl-6-methoxyphenol hydroxylase-like FAD-dependent oxidoreductase